MYHKKSVENFRKRSEIHPVRTTCDTNVGMETNVAPKYFSIHSALEAAGYWGRYQIYVIVVIQYAAIIYAGTFALGTLSQLYPVYDCADPNFHSLHNVTYENTRCTINQYCNNKTLIIDHFYSIEEDFNLICDRHQFMIVLLICSAMGRFIAYLIGGWIADHFGRKRVLYPSQYGLCIVGALSVACVNWQSLAVCFFIIGLMYGFGEISLFVLVMESTDSAHRWYANASFQWPIQYPIAALIAYLSGTWRMYTIIINVILAPALIFFLVLSESPRWLLYHGYVARGAKALTDIGCRWHHNPEEVVPEHLAMITKVKGDDPTFPTPFMLFRNKVYARLSIVLLLCMFTRSCVSNELAILAHSRGENPFIDISLYGLTRIWVPFAMIALDKKFKGFGRRKAFLLSLFAVIFVLSVLFTLEVLDLFHGYVRNVVGLFGAALSSSAYWMSVAMIIIEAFPTAIRGTAYGFIGTGDAIGFMTASAIGELDQIWRGLTPLVLISLCVVCWILGYLVFPETKGIELKDKIDQIHLHKKKSRESARPILNSTPISSVSSVTANI